MGRRLTLTIERPPPQLVAEVVSPGRQNRGHASVSRRQRDLIRKRAQYAARFIPEYWLIDSQNQTVTVLALSTGEYSEVGIFGGSDRVISPTFPDLQLTAEQILSAG